MAILVSKSLSGTYFSATVPDVEFTVSGNGAGVIIDVDGQEIFNEKLFPVDGKIRLRDLSNLLTPYARQSLVVNMTIRIVEDSGTDDGEKVTMSAKVIYCTADFGMNNDTVNVSQFCETHFLSILLGQKTTAAGRLEFLHYLGTDTATVTANYSDGTTETFTPPKVQGNDKYTTIDVSPRRFIKEGVLLTDFTVEAGERLQEFVMDMANPDCAPVLIFENSFGCDELIYCTGTHKVAPTYDRSSTYIDGLMRNYDIKETRTFKADTGILNTAMANWFDDLFRSDNVRIVNFHDGEPSIGKEITITESKSEYSNDDDEMPRFTFSYRYAQRNQNVIDIGRAGRIFDNTFDNTFN